MLNFTIVKREFTKIVFSKGFLLSTFGAPIFLGLYVLLLGGVGIGAGLATANRLNAKEQKPLGIVDQAGVLSGATTDLSEDNTFTCYELPVKKELEAFSDFEVRKKTTVTCQMFESVELARTALLEESVSQVALIAEDFVKSQEVQLYSIKPDIFNQAYQQHALRELVQENLLKKFGIADETIPLLKNGPTFDEFRLDESGEVIPNEEDSSGGVEVLQELLVSSAPYAFVSVMIWVLLINSSRLTHSMWEEKESKLVDVLLSSITPEELISGKVIGILAASLLQMTIWLSIVAAAPILIALSMPLELNLQLSLARFLMSFAITVLGMLFFSYLLAGLGAFSRDPREVGGLKVILGLAQSMTMIGLLMLLPGADAFWWRICSSIPFLTPFLVPIQLCNGDYSLVEAAVFLVLMACSVVVVARFSGRLLRVGVMIQGQNIGLLSAMKLVYRG